MDYQKFVDLLSKPRLHRYLVACQNQEKYAIELYYASLILSGYYCNLISVFEVLIRNKISDFLVKNLSLTWLIDLGQDGSPLDTLRTKDCFIKIREALRLTRTPKPANDQVLTELSFGFWVAMFQNNNYSAFTLATGKSLVQVFPHRPPATKQADIQRRLNWIRKFRNRIAHNEPIIFGFKETAKKYNLAYAIDKEKIVGEITTWLGIDMMIYGDILDRIQAQKTVCDQIQKTCTLD